MAEAPLSSFGIWYYAKDTSMPWIRPVTHLRGVRAA
jgi:hypothetical protein